MAKYILKRCVSIIVTLFLVCTITFIMMKAVPGGPFTTERNLPQNVLEALERKYHLDNPVWKQYVD